MKRFTDKKYGEYSVHWIMQTGIDVKCPNCNKRGIVTRQDGIYQFVCTCCNKSMKTERFHHEYDVENYKLTTLCDYYYIYRNDAHRSLSDCYATFKLFMELLNEKDLI